MLGDVSLSCLLFYACDFTVSFYLFFLHPDCSITPESLYTYITMSYHQQRCEFDLRWWRGVLNTTLCNKVCQWLAVDRWFSPVSSTNKTNHRDITITLHTLHICMYFFINHLDLLRFWALFFFFSFFFSIVFLIVFNMHYTNTIFTKYKSSYKLK